MGTSFGRGGATTFQQDLANADCILIEGSNMAECHPVGFQWVMEAKARGAKVIHVDPRFTRTSALADIHVPLRAGTDIAFLGGIVHYVLQEEKYFREYLLAYSNAATIIAEEFADTEDLDGVFSGLNREQRSYDTQTWQYAGSDMQAASGERDQEWDERTGEGSSVSEAGRGEAHGSGGAEVGAEPEVDVTLQHPRCVFQILKRHFARYTPEMVEQICGVPQATFRQVCELLAENSGRDRTSAFAYAVGWTQHTVGVQYIRTAAILQTLLGNIGRPGGGILALRGHASIQGSTDIPTLFNLLPGYIPMPHAHTNEDLDTFVEAEGTEKGYWGNMKSYLVSLLKAYWGPAARPDNDFCFDHLPRLTGSHSTYETVMEQLKGTCKGYFLLGENPAVGSANAKMQRLGMANLDWLVVRDFSLIESAMWWKDGPEIESGELRTEDIATEVFFLPAAAHTEKDGSFTNTQRMLQWHHQAVEPAGDARSDLWFTFHLGRKIREKLLAATMEASTSDEQRERDRPVLELTWDYPTKGETAEPEAEAVLAEINGWNSDAEPLESYEQLKDDGSTACGCWIYCGVYKDGVNQASRRKPTTQQNWVAPEWGWAWPANRRILYNRASADPDGKPWSDRKALVWWDAEEGKWTGHDVPDFKVTKAPDFEPDEGATGPDALTGTDAFIMQADGKAWLYAPAGLTDGPLPTHYEPQDSPFPNLLYPQQRNPVRQVIRHKHNRFQPSGTDPGSEVFPFVVTTYRLTEHHTAGGMSRWQPYLAELQPELFCEISPELARERGLEHLGWATIATARGVIEARVLVTERLTPLKIQGRTLHQVGLPYHWGQNGLTTGDTVNELISLSLDPNSHIQETKAAACDIRPGRRPRGPGRAELVRQYQHRAGITPETGTEV
ncbi:formate dehydrogenase [Amycolatopsis mediterranei]|uniref:Formate dehydrogenase alpha subunit, selenocysteine-containing protein n=1 Tax=Amycolatopsis mediterranei (strain S699) TaxID=713604 RepID=A0A9R0P122_AMYMS|nr:formate dehydrogenase alpha subunit, selenocysteine-containing protein [Amycolatopsis mediterranei S699]KDO12583.1 formate dehydrogenase [Amycolatopsis mediterranei]KDU88667.1 formate dehydrogenase [Amycolatopsis mediterranei]